MIASQASSAELETVGTSGSLHDDEIHDRNPMLAHHFDNPKHQFDAGKLGTWIFLITEILFFAGLFCAYAVYRAQHPDVFRWAHYFLDWKLGAVNTAILLSSSLTAAWAVRCAQKGQTRGLLLNIVLTVVFAVGFLGIKYVEYSHKIHDGLLPGVHFRPRAEAWETPAFRARHPEAAQLARDLSVWMQRSAAERKPTEGASAPSDTPARVVVPAAIDVQLRNADAVKPLIEAGIIGNPRLVAVEGLSRPKQAHSFFSIYFFMTGLHGVHVVAGIVVWLWLLRRTTQNHFGPRFFGPVDFGALYWHLVDLVWIYLFPLLYLVS
jgi:cytochrome c oxidase subunit 3